MDIQDAWQKAAKKTEIIRSRIMGLHTFEETKVGYIILSASSINPGDTVVRSGEVVVDKPALLLPANIPQFEGFEFDDIAPNLDSLVNFLLVRGVSLPSYKYNNHSNKLDIFEGRIDEAIKFYGHQLERQENTTSGLLVGPEDVWQFSLLIFICSQIARNGANDIKRIVDDFYRRNN